MDFNCSLKLIKLRQTLSETMGSPDIYLRDKVPQDIYETIVKFAELRKLDRANLVRDFDLYPDVANLLNMERKYGDAIYHEDIYGAKKRRLKRSHKVAADGTKIPDGTT
jgi:hypothetical protein